MITKGISSCLLGSQSHKDNRFTLLLMKIISSLRSFFQDTTWHPCKSTCSNRLLSFLPNPHLEFRTAIKSEVSKLCNHQNNSSVKWSIIASKLQGNRKIATKLKDRKPRHLSQRAPTKQSSVIHRPPEQYSPASCFFLISLSNWSQMGVLFLSSNPATHKQTKIKPEWQNTEINSWTGNNNHRKTYRKRNASK